MRRRMLGLTMVLGLFLLGTEPAFAGGWWTWVSLDRNPIGVGETVTAETEVLFESLEAVEAAKEADFFVYLLVDVDRAMIDAAMTGEADRENWWTPPDDRTLLGDVHLSGWDINLAVATAEFVVPDVAPGSYGLMFCDTGCEHPLADVIPRLDVQIAADPLTAQTARDVAAATEEMRALIDGLRSGVYPLRVDMAAVRRDAADAAAGIGHLEPAVRDLEARVQGLATGRNDLGPGAMAGWFVAGAAAAFVLSAALRRRNALALIAEAEAATAEHAAEPGLLPDRTARSRLS